MLENIQTSFIINKLVTLGKLAKTKDCFKDCLLREFPNAIQSIEEYRNLFFDYRFYLDNYEIKLNNITYGFEEEKNEKVFVYIKVDDIVIYHNRERNSCDGIFEGIETGWNHNSPIGLLNQIKIDSMIVKNAIKNIKKKSNRSTKWMDEQEKLNEIFK